MNRNFFAAVDEIKKICNPLKLLGITDFFFMRIYDDGSLINFTTHPEWSEFFFSKLYQNHYEQINGNSHFYLAKYINLWAHYPDDIIWREGKDLFFVGNGITLLHKHHSFDEGFSFFTDRNNFKQDDFYLSMIDALEKFIVYFKISSQRLILQAEIDKITIPPKYQKMKNIYADASAVKDVSNFLDIINVDKYFNRRGLFSQMTFRECECLHWMGKGKSAEETGYILGCSKRTVEVHIKNIKEKTCITKNTELIYYATKYGLI